jgi:hypothetical protein
VTSNGSGLPTTIVCAPAGSCPSPFVSATIPALATSSTAGSSLSGSPISGAVNSDTLVPIPPPADARTAALSQTIGTGTGGAQAGLTLNSLTSFVANQGAGSISLSFDADLILKAWANFPLLASATAGSTLSFSLVDTTGGVAVDVFSWAPGSSILGGTVSAGSSTTCNLQATAAITFPAGGTNDKSCTGHFEAAINSALIAGHAYTFGITQQSNTNVTSVGVIPEPSALALAGLALALTGFVSRRRG